MQVADDQRFHVAFFLFTKEVIPPLWHVGTIIAHSQRYLQECKSRREIRPCYHLLSSDIACYRLRRPTGIYDGVNYTRLQMAENAD
ncbi:MAG TPA: hypothetical protein PK156_17010 [Polyangium sp.]|nr:hypothetical protein [Polyangium sp.]